MAKSVQPSVSSVRAIQGARGEMPNADCRTASNWSSIWRNFDACLRRPGCGKGTQAMLLTIALYRCRADWETRRLRRQQGISIAKEKGVHTGRKPDTTTNAKIIELRDLKFTLAAIAKKLSANESQAKLILKAAPAQSATRPKHAHYASEASSDASMAGTASEQRQRPRRYFAEPLTFTLPAPMC